MVLTLIGLRPDLESIRDQILASPLVPSLDDVFARLLRLSSTQTLLIDGPSDSSVLASQTNSRGGHSDNRGRGQHRCYQLHGRPPHTAHIVQSSDPLLSRLDSAASFTSQSITLIGSDYDAYLRYQAATSAFAASVAQTGNVSIYFSQSSSLSPWILDSGASDHISGNKHLFSSITTTSTLPTVTLVNGSQTMAKVCISTDAHLLIHSRLGHPSLSKFQKMVPRFSTLSSLAFILCSYSSTKWGAEHKNRHLVETARILLLHSHVPFHFWGDAILIAYYLINNMPSSILHDQIPHSLIFPTQSLYFLPLRVFGCTYFVHTLTPGQDKLSAKATKCIFLGYSRLQNGYHCYYPDTHRYFLFADVTFSEDSPFFSSSESFPISEYCHFPIYPLNTTQKVLFHSL
uniref:Retrovirus-related Pol polyprotein from transposon TNT 1-94 n=1 Tax=Vitis vinifera TaxID=29760 RepID=A5AYR1_VITVI|nr:hypothetical protein VITISV_032532 [Vitis vinifera]